MSGLREPEAKTFTWSDYQAWPAEERWEIIGGEAFSMSPYPNTRHQRVAHQLDRLLGNFFAGKSCRVFPAPTGVKLSDTDVVIPDLLIVCDADRIKPSHIEGAPDLIIEILSPSTAYHDRIRKIDLYARHGVKEIWLVTPFPSSVEIFVLDGDSYRLKALYGKEDTLESPLFPGLAMALEEVFDFPVDPDEDLYLVREGRPAYGRGV